MGDEADKVERNAERDTPEPEARFGGLFPWQPRPPARIPASFYLRWDTDARTEPALGAGGRIVRQGDRGELHRADEEVDELPEKVIPGRHAWGEGDGYG